VFNMIGFQQVISSSRHVLTPVRQEAELSWMYGHYGTYSFVNWNRIN
jgi:hypothetical protein